MILAEHEKDKSKNDAVLSNMRADFNQKITSDFKFVNQYNEIVDQQTFDDKIYVADFFFINCPTICPLMGSNKIRIQNRFAGDSDVLLLSHSIDILNDSVPSLSAYATTIGALKDKWHLVTGDQEAIYGIAKEYYVTAQESGTASGSYLHDGSFILIDKKRRIRGIYDGTQVASTEELIDDIEFLLHYE